MKEIQDPKIEKTVYLLNRIRVEALESFISLNDKKTSWWLEKIDELLKINK